MDIDSTIQTQNESGKQERKTSLTTVDKHMGWNIAV